MTTQRKISKISTALSLAIATMIIGLQQKLYAQESSSLKSIPTKAFSIIMKSAQMQCLGVQNANPKYFQQIETFLQSYKYQDVHIKRLEPTKLTSYCLLQNPLFYITNFGIWVNEQALAKMTDAELFFQLCFASTIFHQLDTKENIINFFCQTTPLTAPTLLICLAAQFDLVKLSGVSVLKNVTKLGTCFALACVNNIIYKQLSRLTKITLSSQKARTNSNLIATTVKTLVNNGFAWVVEEYQAILEKRHHDKQKMVYIGDKILPVKFVIEQLRHAWKNIE